MENVDSRDAIIGILIPILLAVLGVLWKKIDGMPEVIDNALDKIEASFNHVLSGALGRIDKDQADQWSRINETRDDLKAFMLDAEKRFAGTDDLRTSICELRSDMRGIDQKLDFLIGIRPAPQAGA